MRRGNLNNQPVFVKHCMAFLLVAFSIGQAGASVSRSLSTPSYSIILTSDCRKSATTCDEVTFTSSHKKTGVVEVLRGKKLMAVTKNHASSSVRTEKKEPTRYIYKFVAPNKQIRIITYDGQFLKMDNNKVVFQQQGQWLKRQ